MKNNQVFLLYGKIVRMIIQIILIILGALIFLFSFWRRLKDDYFESQIFTTGFYIFFFVLLMNIVAAFFVDAYWFWSSLVGVLLGLGLSTFRFKMRFFESLEAAVSALFTPTIIVLLYDGISSRKPQSFFAIAAICVLIGMYYFLSNHYKRISWYKSGRVGFAGVSVLGIFFLLRALVAVWFPNMISFVGYEWIVSGSAAFLSFLTLFHLANKV